MKDNKLSKYLSFLIAGIALVGAILFIRVFMQDAEAIENDPEVQKSVVNPIIFFSTSLLYLAIGITVVLSVWSVIKNPQNLKKLVLGLGLLTVILLISYFMADSNAVLDTQDKVLEGGEAGTAMNQWVGTGIWFSMALGLIASLFFVFDLIKGLIKS
jgi:succinate dehydrogenase hydrophobic anchor subunit